MALIDKVIERIATQRLVELTNSDSSVLVINTTVLQAACDDAEGEFSRIVGIIPDSAIKAHVSLCVQGVMFFLEDYKGRDGNIINSHKKGFYAGCESLKQRAYGLARTSSKLLASKDANQVPPDMDRENKAWHPGFSRANLKEISE